MSLYQRILVPVDGSETANRGLAEAIRLAGLTGGSLRLIHVADEVSVAFAMNAYAGVPGDWSERIRADSARVLDLAKSGVEAAGLRCDTVQVDNFSGAVHEKIVAEANRWPADLIVIGTHGRRGIGRLVLGSSAENVLRSASVPVLLVRSDAEPAQSTDDATR
jgi:nucleotide-binding universal stress UspA family protein